MTNTTEREQIVAWLRDDPAGKFKPDDSGFAAMVARMTNGFAEQFADRIEAGDHLKESPHG